MATSNHERVGKALEHLKDGLAPFVEREMQAVYGEKAWMEAAQSNIRNERDWQVKKGKVQWDAHLLLSVMWNNWNNVFARTLGHADRSIVAELRTVRNNWAHQKAFSTDDAYRALDSMHRLLTAVAADEAKFLDDMRQDLLRLRFEEQARHHSRKVSAIPVEGEPASGLRPWRELATPHDDVSSGNYQRAEFAADLAQVHEKRASTEYGEPREFFERTFLTEGLQQLLSGALKRITGKGGDPVVKLQTNFGGGKTHSLLALYHLFADVPANELLGVDSILSKLKIQKLPRVTRAVLVGTAHSPAKTYKKADGTVVHTFWGDLAWQLGGKKGYKLVELADKKGVSPGSEELLALFNEFGPCLILIDEWVAHVRQLYSKEGLPAGTFDSHFTFVQALTEAAKQTNHSLVVASIPSSEIEQGGEGGKEALKRLENVFRRIESPWRPARQEESYEIVRRRLFIPMDSDRFPQRDAVIKAFIKNYKQQAGEFPNGVAEGDYEKSMKTAYPVHPELFERLYTDWGALEKFQRTRGVLRLMAAVIHELWERNDTSLLIMPASVPLDASPVIGELKHYLEDNWVPIVELDVDGPHSQPLKLDRDNPNLGRYSACRRVARTIYLGSAPSFKTAHPGLDEKRIKLGCAQPGESVATFGDALRRLTDTATHLYVDQKRYWFSTQPSVTKTAQERAAQQDIHDVWEELRKRLRADRQRGSFAAVHAAPGDSSQVPDDMEVRLVILDPEHAHARKTVDSRARAAARDILENRGTSPRLYRNMLIFLAADEARLSDLEQAIRQFLAWSSIVKDKETLNLDAFQNSQASTKKGQAEDAVNQRIYETYVWALVPAQKEGETSFEFDEVRVPGNQGLAVRTSRKLENNEQLITRYSATRLNMMLDKYGWQGKDHVGLKKLWEYFASYIYLERLKDSTVLCEAIQDGIKDTGWSEFFAYAEAWDESKKRYLGLKAGVVSSVIMDEKTVLVTPKAAQEQLDKVIGPKPDNGDGDNGDGNGKDRGGEDGYGGGVDVGEKAKTRFHGSKKLEPIRLTRDAGQIADEIVQHLVKLPGSHIEVTIEIHAKIPDGADEQIQRTVNENCKTLKFENFGFEEQ